MTEALAPEEAKKIVDDGLLRDGEVHPATENAYNFLASIDKKDLDRYMETFAELACKGNRTASICLATLGRLYSGIPASDRYILGLAWTIKEFVEQDARNAVPKEEEKSLIIQS